MAHWSDDYLECGMPVVSDPNSNIGMFAVGPWDGSPHFRHGFAGMAVKVSNPDPLVREFVKARDCDAAYYPQHTNVVQRDGTANAWGRWRTINGVPTGIWEYGSTRVASAAFTSFMFTWNNVAIVVTESDGTDGIRMGMGVHSADASAKIETDEGVRLIKIEDHVSGYHLAATCTDMSQFLVDSSRIDVSYGIGTDPAVTVSHDACWMGMGHDFGTEHGVSVFVWSWDLDALVASANVRSAMLNWQTWLEEAEQYWVNLLTPVRQKWSHLPYDLQMTGLIAAQQVVAQMYNGFLSAGLSSRPDNFLRDTAHVALGLADVMPSVAKDLMHWFHDAESLQNRNEYLYNKNAMPYSYWNTDNGAMFLLAVAKVFRVTSDLSFLSDMKVQMDRALLYAQTYYVAVDGHITANHAHDFWDDYSAIVVGDVKYESFVDVIWMVALQQAALLYSALADTARESFCTETVAGLEAHFEEYRLTDGGLLYAFKTDNSPYSDAIAMTAPLYSAWLRNDQVSAEWLLRHSKGLAVRECSFDLGVQFSRMSNEQSPVSGWGPFAPAQAMLAARYFGIFTYAFYCATAFRNGGWPEGISTQRLTGRLVWNDHAYSFPWASGAVVEMVQEMSVLLKRWR